MEIDSNWLTMDDQIDIYIRKWIVKNEHPKAILQLSHGMAEHIERYDHFARYMMERGIFVYGNDHRGHGQTGKKMGVLGFFAEKNGFERVVDDLYTITKWIQNRHPKVPIFILGHSMGSIVVRRYIQKYTKSIDGVILSGMTANPGVAVKFGKMIAKWAMNNKGPKTPTPTLDRLSFGSYNKRIPQPKTPFDWLTHDEIVVEKYIKDPLCGFICTSSFFHDLFTGMEIIHNQEGIQAIRKDLPLFIFSGSEDPVGGYEKGIHKIIEQYKRNGLTQIKSLLFEKGRHEMLNETNKDEVYLAVYQWVSQHV